MAAGRAVTAAFSLVKVSYSTLGNTVPHLHTHVVPRFTDDAAPSGPLAWDAIVGPTAATETALRKQAVELRKAGRGS